MIPLTDLTELQRAAYEWADDNDPDKSHLAKVGEASSLAIFIEKRIGMALKDQKRLHLGELLSKDKHINALTDRSVQLALELEKVEHLGSQMSNCLYNVKQEGFKIGKRDREVMGELVKKWDDRKKS